MNEMQIYKIAEMTKSEVQNKSLTMPQRLTTASSVNMFCSEKIEVLLLKFTSKIRLQ